MPKETAPTINSKEAKNKKLAYNVEFRNKLREHPGIINTAIELADKAVAQYDPPINPIPLKRDFQIKFDRESGKWLEETMGLFPEDGEEEPTMKRGWGDLTYGRGTILVPGEPIKDEKTGLEIILLGRCNRKKGFHENKLEKSDYFKLTLDGKSFFIKRSLATSNPGFVEFHDTLKAKELLKNLKFVKVLDAQLGYLDKNESWYVSKWEDLQKDIYVSHTWLEDDYGTSARSSIETEGGFKTQEEEYSDIREKGRLIKEKLKPLSATDFDANLLYSFQTKTFILFDVTSGKNKETLGQEQL